VTSVNVCDVFDVIGSFRNCSQLQIATSAQLSVEWTGPANLLFEEAYDPQYNMLNPHTWFDFDPGSTVVTDIGSGWSRNTQIHTICQCCACLAKWTFQCEGPGTVYYRFRMEWEDPLNNVWVDYSETFAVTQQWKAHLIAGVKSFVQDEDNCLMQRNAFAPCQNFHIVLPVVNTGNTTAENVTVEFDLLGDESYWELVSISGDGSLLLDMGSHATPPPYNVGHTYLVSLGDIPGGEMRKAIIQVHCEAEGDIAVLILDVDGNDANTGVDILSSNIERWECNYLIKQIPFDVEIINPWTCQNINQGDEFAVKAVVENLSSSLLEDVQATLYWQNGYGQYYWGASLSGGAYVPGTPTETVQSLTKSLGNLTAGSTHEITWELECEDAGELYLWVVAGTGYPYYLAGKSSQVNVHRAITARTSLRARSSQ
jgi:hypothetical protein